MRTVPVPDPRVAGSDAILEGEVPNPAAPPSACYFHPRCRFAEDRCRREAPPLREVRPGHFVRCHFAEELSSASVWAWNSSVRGTGNDVIHVLTTNDVFADNRL